MFMIFVYGLARYRESLTTKDIPKNYKKDVDVEHYLNVVINLIKNRGKWDWECNNMSRKA